jgi:cytokinin dehydrogenase
MRHRPTRRSFLGGLATGPLVVGFDPLTRSWVTEPSAGGSLDGLPPLDGHVLVDPETRERAADDFGHIIHRYPLAVLRPGSVSDVAAMIKYCRKRDIPVAPRGQAHTTFGQAQVSKGLVIEMGTLRAVRVEGGSAVVEAGARWSEVLQATLPRGLTPGVLTDYLELSIGGTLSAGGVGGASQRHGAQVDLVRELLVVTGTGERVVCSPTRRADLFNAVLAGLGQCAIIARATIRLAPALRSVRRYQLFYPTVAALTADQRRVVADGRFGYVEGQVLPMPDGSPGWRFLLEAAAFFDDTPPDDDALIGDLSYERGSEVIDNLGYFDFLNRLAPIVEFLKSTGEWFHPHPWWNGFLPDDDTDALVTSILDDLTPADIGPSGVILLYPLRRALLRRPLLRVPGERIVFLFALLKTASPGTGGPGPEQMVRANRALYERVRARGGTQYPVGSIPMSPVDWRRHFGDAWGALVAAKRRYDPDNILTPGQGIFPR